jgi:hypothetical protein
VSPTKTAAADDESLKRLGGGRWQTRDERFTIEPQSGTWAVVDAEETDDLGLPLVRGPFRSLTDAKAAIASARTETAPASPLAKRLEEGRTKRSAVAEKGGGGVKKARASATQATDEPEEPGWLRDLSPAQRGRARRLIERLSEDHVTDAASIVRRDLVGDVPALAAHAIEQRLAALPGDATAAQVVRVLADGGDEALGVRWRIVDGDGRPIVIEPPKASRRRT